MKFEFNGQKTGHNTLPRTMCAKWRRLWAVTSLLVVCETWAAVGGVTVTAIGYDVSPPVISMAWLDNKRLLFAGGKSNADPKKVSFDPSRIYIWDDESKTAREYANASGFCFGNGWISYGKGEKDEAGNMISYRGAFGKEELVKSPPGKPKVYLVSNRFSCKPKPITDFNPSLPTDRAYLVLREGDGFLSLEPHDKKDAYWQHPRNITLFREKGSPPVSLPITWDEGVQSSGVTYSEYLKTYLIYPWKFLSARYPSKIPGEKGPGPWPKDEPRVVYSMSPATGKVERLVFPPDMNSAKPVNGGWIYSSGDPYKVGSAGLYADIGGKKRQLDAGNLSRTVVSPDGCRVAIAIDNGYLKVTSPPTTIKVINLCSERK